MNPNQNLVDKAVNRIMAINWKQTTYDKYLVVFFCEYMRRISLWYKALGQPKNTWPFFDVVSLIEPDIQINPATIETLRRHLLYRGRLTSNICLWYVYWAAVKNKPKVAHFGLPSPYTPLITLYEKGGWVHPVSDGIFIEVAGTQTPKSRPDTYIDKMPLKDVNEYPFE